MGWPTGEIPWLASPTLQPIVGWLQRHALQEVITRNLKLEIRLGGRKATWLAQLANTWCVTN
jgi:hypothetical protein